VGKYLYCPRGPVVELETQSVEREMQNARSLVQNMECGMRELLALAKKEKAGWLRIEPENKKNLEIIENKVEINGNKLQIVRAPHDMQPKEVFVLDIAKPEEQLLAEMKSKTRYNIKLAQKKGVEIHVVCNMEHETIHRIQNTCLPDRQAKYNLQNTYLEAFLKLTKEMASRNGITAHPENYYRKMLEILPAEMLKIYVAEYDGEIIAANLMLFYGKTATYLHGASGNMHRAMMAPYLLQWQAILDAKKMGCEKYDFGGVKIVDHCDLTPTLSFRRRGSKGEVNSWSGITDFKLGFSPQTQPIEFPGSYDIILSPSKYGIYRILQKIKGFLEKFHK